MDLTQILLSAEAGDTEARGEVLRAAYDDLRKLAAGRMLDERQNHTLTATALVHEVSLKLLNDSRLPVDGRIQFMSYVSRAMRNLLIDHARTRGRQKRGGDRQRLMFADALLASREQSEDLLALNEALEKLSELDPRKGRVVELRYFGSLSVQEIASALEVSLATVKRDWEVAKVWLKRAMSETDAPDDKGGRGDGASE